MIISLILFALACWIEGIMDRYYEVYKLNLIDWKGVERLNKNWWGYNPLNAGVGLGIMRDGWHFLKAVHYTLIIAAIVLMGIDLLPIDVPVLYMIPALILTRWAVFSISLNVNRKRITPRNNFRP